MTDHEAALHLIGQLSEKVRDLQSRIDGMLSDEAVERAIRACNEPLDKKEAGYGSLERKVMRAAIKAAMGEA